RVSEAWKHVRRTNTTVLGILARSALASVPPHAARVTLLVVALVAALIFDHVSAKLDIMAGSHLRALFFLFFVQVFVLDPLTDRFRRFLYSHAFSWTIG